jgi:epsilon-lactone hydrolase
MSLSLRGRFYRMLLRRLFIGPRLTIEQERARSAQNAKFMNRIPKNVAFERTDIAGLASAWFHPAHADPQKVMLYLHGGGYVVGSIDGYRMMCGQMADQLKLPLLVPEYRLAPEHPFPAAIEDAQKAYRWLLEQGHSAENIILGGDSAGGGLALATGLSLRENSLPLPGAIICISPWADLACESQSHTHNAQAELMLNTETLKMWGLKYAGEESLQGPLISPVHADFHDFPPLLIQVGSDEILLDDARMVAQKARTAGVDVTLTIWEGLWHVWHIFGELVPESKRALEEIGRFIELHSAKSPQQNP